METGRGPLGVGVNRSISNEEITEKNGEDSTSIPATRNSNHESNPRTALTEPFSDLIVWWDEPEDQCPENPMNWSSSKKWMNILVISLISFLV
jgi:hypothetical protein